MAKIISSEWFLAMYLHAFLAICVLPAVAEEPARDLLVMENEHIKVSVDRKIGGRILSFIDKATGCEYAGGGDSVNAGWGEFNKTTFFPESESSVFKQIPYAANLETGPGFKRITVSCSADGLKITRIMTLADNSRQLDILQRYEVLDKPRRIFVRWHPWMKLDDDKGSNTVVIVPGPGRCIRKVHANYSLDNWMRPEIGCLLVANAKTGNGLWMTFQKENVAWVLTWCHGKGEGIGPELFGRAYLGKPGEVLENRLTYFPFTPGDASKDLPGGVIRDAKELETARDFAERVRPHFAQVSSHEVWQKFKHIIHSGSYMRPDVPAIYDWGFAECMFEACGAQDGYIRARFAAQAFPGKTTKLIGRVSVFDIDGALVKKYESGIRPLEGGMVELNGSAPEKAKFDQMVDFPLAGLPDGEYLVKAEMYGEDENQPLYTEARKEVFTGEKTAMMARILEKDGDPQFRPFIVALSEKGGGLSNGVARVTVGVEEAGGLARKDWPVCAALALPQGAFGKDTPARLLDTSGREIPVQIHTASVWPDGSLKWLHLFFGANIPPNGFAFYTAVVGEKPALSKDPMLATGDENSITVDTGPLQYRVARKGEKGIGSVTIGGREMLLAGNNGDIWWEGDQGRRYDFIGEGASILRDGPLAATVLLKGKYVDAKGEAKCLGEIRVEATKGASSLRVFHTTIFIGDPYLDNLVSFGMKLRAPAGKYDKAVALVDGIAKPASGAIILRQVNADRFTDSTSDKKTVKGRVDGVVLLKGTGVPSFAVYAREFWRHYPEKLEVEPASGQIILTHWPKEAGPQEFLPPERYYTSCSSSPEACAMGMSKTHEVVLDWGNAGKAESVLAAYDEPVVAIAAPKWNCATRAFAMLSAFDAKVLPEVEHRIHRMWQCLERHRELFWMYGEWGNGNHRYAFHSADNSIRYSYHGRWVWISNEDHHADSTWYLFARSGDRLFLKDAIGSTRAIRDVATSQYNPVWPEVVGGSARHHYAIWLAMGDYGHSALEGFIMDWILTGDTRSREMAALQADFFLRLRDCSSARWRYISNPLSGLSRMYLETGDKAYKTKADWIATKFATGRELWGGSGDSYFTYGTEAVRWYAEISPSAKQLWVQGVQTNAPKDAPKFTCLGDIGSAWEITADPKLATRACEQGMGLLKKEYTGPDPRFHGIDTNSASIAVHAYTRQALFLARAKAAMEVGAGGNKSGNK